MLLFPRFENMALILFFKKSRESDSQSSPSSSKNDFAIWADVVVNMQF